MPLFGSDWNNPDYDIHKWNELFIEALAIATYYSKEVDEQNKFGSLPEETKKKLYKEASKLVRDKLTYEIKNIMKEL